MIENLLAYAIEFAVQTVFLLAALWIMIKVQKLNHNWPGLIGAAALTSSLDMIPHFGHYLAVPVLLFCVAKITRADSVDVVFTVVVGYALMFGMNLWLLSALLGDLRPSAQEAFETGNDPMDIATEHSESSETNLPVVSSQATNKVNTTPAPAAPPPVANPVEAKAVELAREAFEPFSLKGVIRSAKKPMATIHTGTKTYTIAVGESLSVETAKGKVTVRCEEVGEDFVILDTGAAQVKLRLW